jgi:hypothetical protein
MTEHLSAEDACTLVVLRQQLTALEQRAETHLARAREAEAALAQREREVLQRSAWWAAEHPRETAYEGKILGWHESSSAYADRMMTALAKEEK